MSNIPILMSEPLKNVEPDDIRAWLKEHVSEAELAEITAKVWQKTGWLHHELNDDPPTVTREYYFRWDELEEELIRKIIAILNAEGINVAYEDGTINAISPFMNRNGFFNRSGWWIRSAPCDK